MLRVNKLLAKISVAIAFVLLLLWLVTPLWNSALFSLFVIFWCVITSSALYRVTPLFKNRNPVEELIKRDVNQLALISLAGLFDFKRKAEFVLIGQIKTISVGEGSIVIEDINSQRLHAVLSVSKAEIISHIHIILSARERQKITITS